MELDKKQQRKLIIQQRLDLSNEDYLYRSNLIINKLKNDPDFIQANSIAIYISFNNEVDTTKLIKQYLGKKHIYVPKIYPNHLMQFIEIKSLDDLQKNKYGILEPIDDEYVDCNQLDLIIVPLVGYNDNNYRLGYGGGYYDRYLQNYHGKTIGLAFLMQYNKHFSINEYDIPLDKIINEN